MNYPLSLIKSRPVDSHKGTFGTVKLLCGSRKYTGAALLCCEGALRSGCGMVKLFADERTCAPVRTRLPEVINCLPEDFLKTAAQSAVIGCGISDCYNEMLAYIIKGTEIPTVIDADGINFLSAHKDLLREAKSDIVLTPHPMEFSRLTGIEVTKINANRIGYAEEYSRLFNCTVVLKGHNTVIATPDRKTVINETGSTALAKGGSGDVLAGVIGSLLAQGYDCHTAAVIGVYAHGKAADVLAEQYGLHGVLPSDLPKVIGKILG